jgi:hypothetical protein
MINNFKIDENLKVEFLIPDLDSDIFILGISLLGGEDVLGGYGEFVVGVSLLGGDDVLAPSSGLKWQEVSCETSSAEISLGGQVIDTVYFQPQPATANLTLQSYMLDPTVNKNIRASTKIRIRLEDPELDRILFQGNIDTIDVTYYPDGLNLIRITSFDAYKNLVNSRFATWNTDILPGSGFATVDEIMELVGIQSGLGISSKSVSLEGKIPSVDQENVLVSSIINEALQVGLGIVWINQDSEKIVYIPRPVSETGTSTTYVIGNNHPVPPATDPYHLCLSEIKVYSDADAVYNSLKVTLASDDSQTVVLKDQDSIDLYGESAIDLSLNTTDSTELARWATEVFTYQPENLVSRVVTPSIDRLGTLTDAAVFTPGMTVGVSYTNNQLDIVGFYTIIKVSHRIDVDNWFTTLELWKEA